MLDTRASLLLRIRDPKDHSAWAEFVKLYAPVLHAYGMRHGLQDADAADLAQDTLQNVLRAAPTFEYDPAKGAFRGWLFTVARNQIRKFATRKDRLGVGAGDSDVRDMLAEHPDRSGDEAEWDREYKMHLFRWAADRVQTEFRAATWQAFWRTAVGGEAAEAVAADLGMTVGAVYIARSRVTARIRTETAAADGEDSP